MPEKSGDWLVYGLYGCLHLCKLACVSEIDGDGGEIEKNGALIQCHQLNLCSNYVSEFLPNLLRCTISCPHIFNNYKI